MEHSEKIVYRNHPSLSNYFIFYVVGGGVSLLFYHFDNIPAALVSLVILIIVVAILRARHLFTITADRAIAREGLISRDTTEIQLKYILGTRITQGITERILGIGSVEIFSSAETSSRIYFRGIRDPHAVKDMINQLLQA